jgi:hypothetical protein
MWTHRWSASIPVNVALAPGFYAAIISIDGTPQGSVDTAVPIDDESVILLGGFWTTEDHECHAEVSFDIERDAYGWLSKLTTGEGPYTLEIL